MKLAFITPTEYIEMFGSQGDFTLALSHLLGDEENDYERAIKKAGLPIILDNGLFENHIPEGYESLLSKAQRIGAHTAFCPDYLYDKDRTLHEITVAFPHFQAAGIQLAAVAQGNTKEELMDAFIQLNEDPRVSLIGLSILSIPHCYGMGITESRLAFITDIMELKMSPMKSCHMLGLGDSYVDVLFAATHCPWIVSNDSSSCFWNAVQGKRILPGLGVEGGKTQVPVDFNFNSLNLGQASLVHDNITRVKYAVKS